MKEAMERALSGGRPKDSLNKFMRKMARPDLADSPDKKNKLLTDINKTDYSNSYVMRAKSNEKPSDAEYLSYIRPTSKKLEVEPMPPCILAKAT